MFRIPGSLNSIRIQLNDKGEIIGDIPPEAKGHGKVMQRWDGNKPSIKPLLTQYYIWLQAAAIRDIKKWKAEQKSRNYRRRQA